MVCCGSRALSCEPGGETGARFGELLRKVQLDHAALFTSVPLVFCASALFAWRGWLVLLLISAKLLVTECIFQRRLRECQAWIASHCEEDPYQKFMAILSSAPRFNLRTCFSAQLDVYAATSGCALREWLEAGNAAPVSASISDAIQSLLRERPVHMVLALAVAVLLQVWAGRHQLARVREEDTWDEGMTQMWRRRWLRLQPAMEYCHAYALASSCGQMAHEVSSHIPKELQVTFDDVYETPVFIEKKVVEGALFVWFAVVSLGQHINEQGCSELPLGELLWVALSFCVSTPAILHGLLAWRPFRPANYCCCLVLVDLAVLLLAAVVLVLSTLKAREALGEVIGDCGGYRVSPSTVTVV